MSSTARQLLGCSIPLPLAMNSSEGHLFFLSLSQTKNIQTFLFLQCQVNFAFHFRVGERGRWALKNWPRIHDVYMSTTASQVTRVRRHWPCREPEQKESGEPLFLMASAAHVKSSPGATFLMYGSASAVCVRERERCWLGEHDLWATPSNIAHPSSCLAT